MPKVKLTRNLGAALREKIGGACKKGDVLDVQPQMSEYLTAKGLGLAVDEPKAEPAKTEQQPAAVEPKPAKVEAKPETKPSKGSK